MRKILPYLLSFIVVFSVFFTFKATVFADTTTSPAEGAWVQDSDVTFVGKVGARAGEFLDWTLAYPNWSTVGGKINPIEEFWKQIRNIVYAFFALFVLVSAFILIISRGKNITVSRFIPKFVIIVIAVTLSFAVVQFIYQIFDVIQGFFLKNPEPTCAKYAYIYQCNLLNIGFNYKDFVGYRLFGAIYDESAFMSLLLVKLTAATYYTMSGVLLIRKIILWFFIIVSPIFPLLVLYSPIRNTAKIWVGEFFRWLLYGPLFAIFLSGLVAIWRTGIPLSFKFTPNEVVYPTAVNILLGGPGQSLSLTNSVNNQNTFAQYIVALLMLWVVIILPFLLLQIFLDYLNTLSLSENSTIKRLLAGGSNIFNKGTTVAPPPPPPLPSQGQSTGMAKTIPFSAKIEIPEIKTQSISVQRANIQSLQTDLAKLTNLSVPTMRDIARFESASMSSDVRKYGEIAKYHEALSHLLDPKKVGAPIERQKYTEFKNRLVNEGQKGNQFANSVLAAASTIEKPGALTEIQKENAKLNTVLAQLANPQGAPLEKKQHLLNLKDELEKAGKNGDPLATSIMTAMQKGEGGIDEQLKEKLKEAKDRGNALAAAILMNAEKVDISQLSVNPFPVVNRVQSVSLDDYEAVRKMWQENYLNMEPPKSFDAKTKGRKEWVSFDINKISLAIEYLTSTDPANIKKGMDSVGNILPFLLIGGFSQTEVITYLKAKLEAAKSVLLDLGKKEEEEETMVERKEGKEEKAKEMETEEKIDPLKDKEGDNE